MKAILKFALVILSASMSFGILAAEATATKTPQYEEGKQYQRISEDLLDNKVISDLNQKVKENHHVQILEFFSYACHWCHKVDPLMEQWAKKAPKYVEFHRIPVEFQPAWATLTKSYYTAEQLKVLDKIHPALFDAIFSDKLTSSSEETLQKFFEEKGVKPDTFKKVFESDAIAEKQKWANAVSKAYRITAIPAVIVQGPQGTFITTPRSAGSEAEVVAVVDYLTKMQTRLPEKKGK